MKMLTKDGKAYNRYHEWGKMNNIKLAYSQAQNIRKYCQLANFPARFKAISKTQFAGLYPYFFHHPGKLSDVRVSRDTYSHTYTVFSYVLHLFK